MIKIYGQRNENQAFLVGLCFKHQNIFQFNLIESIRMVIFADYDKIVTGNKTLLIFLVLVAFCCFFRMIIDDIVIASMLNLELKFTFLIQKIKLIYSFF